jgi:hypothetical protein
MDADRSIDLATATKQASECQMGLDRVAVDLDQLQEYVDCLVGLLLQKIVQTAQKCRMRTWLAVALPRPLAPRQPPSGGSGKRQEQEQKLDHGHPRHCGQAEAATAP